LVEKTREGKEGKASLRKEDLRRKEKI